MSPRPVEVRLVGNESSAVGAINRTDRELRQLDRTASGVDKRMGGMFKRLGAGLLAGGAIYKVGGLIKESVTLAGELNDAVSATEQVFGKSGKAIVGWADANNSALMMTERQALDAVTGFQLLLRNQGLAGKEAEKWSKTLTTLGADMASFRGTSTADAVSALSAVMKGEYDSIEKYGVTLNEAKIKEEAYRLGLYSGKGALSERAKVQARLNLVMKQTSSIQGDAKRTEGSYANQSRRLQVNIAGLKASLGQAFIPVAEKYLPRINSFLEGINTKEGVGKLSELFLDIGDGIDKVWQKSKELGRVFREAGGDMDRADVEGALSGAASAAGTLASAAGKAFGAFNDLSPEAKSNIAMIVAAGAAFSLARRNPVVRIGVDLVGGVITSVGSAVAGQVASALASNRFAAAVRITGQPIRVTGITGGVGGSKGGKDTGVVGTGSGTWKSRLGIGAAGLATFLLPELVNRLPLSGKTKAYVDTYAGIASYSAMGFAIFGPPGAVAGAIFGGLSELSKGQKSAKDKTSALEVRSDYLSTDMRAAQVKADQLVKDGKAVERVVETQGTSIYLTQQTNRRQAEGIEALRRRYRELKVRVDGFDIPYYLARPEDRGGRSLGVSTYGGSSSGRYASGYGGATVILQGTVIDPDGAARALRRVLSEHDRRVGTK